MEKLGLYFLFTDGKNRLEELRKLLATTLNYFQAHIMSHDSRFNRPDHFTLSVVEYVGDKTSGSVVCRMRQGENMPHELSILICILPCVSSEFISLIGSAVALN